MTGFLDLTDKRFGRLTAVRYAGNGKWRCKCECGGTAVVLTANLTKGNSTSCGCKRRETLTKHGMADTKIYRIWMQMIRRCHRENDPAYANYGGRGIIVCDRWRENFLNFIADMGARPGGYQIDRTDNDGNYEPGNCRWVTNKVNKNNMRSNRVVEHLGRRQTIAEWADELSMNYRTLNNRINRGWSPEKAFSVAVQKRKARGT
mgnify:CR=1 FL=1